jgi:DNA-directed RNA polymerase subunit RPC12/RpoP
MADDLKTAYQLYDELYAAGVEVIKCPRCGGKSYLVTVDQPGYPPGGLYICKRCFHEVATGEEHRKQWNAVLEARGRKPLL